MPGVSYTWWPCNAAAGAIDAVTYNAFVCGLYVGVVQSTPPPFLGANNLGICVPYASKMHADIQPGTCSAHCGTSASPTGNGCVAAVAFSGSCGTVFSSMPTSGFPLVRS